MHFPTCTSRCSSALSTHGHPHAHKFSPFPLEMASWLMQLLVWVWVMWIITVLMNRCCAVVQHVRSACDICDVFAQVWATSQARLLQRKLHKWISFAFQLTWFWVYQCMPLHGPLYDVKSDKSRKKKGAQKLLIKCSETDCPAEQFFAWIFDTKSLCWTENHHY